MIKIIYEDNHLLVVEKPCNIPVQADDSQDKDLLTLLKEDLKIRFNKPGNVYLGLVQRLDRPVGGVIVFAKTSKAAARLSQQISSRSIQKQYLAVVQGQSALSGKFSDMLIKNNRTNMVTVTTAQNKEAKAARLSYTCVSQKNGLSLVKIDLETGRSHQIRVQFSSRQLPLWGDQRYNPQAKVGQQIALWAVSLTLVHPITKETMTFTSEVPKKEPWNLFREECLCQL